mgnify:CR=1 FL=1
MKPMDFGIKDADLVGMYDVEGVEYLIVEGLDREGVTTRFTMSVFIFDKLRAQYKSNREEFEAEVVRQSLDEPATDPLGHSLPEEMR